MIKILHRINTVEQLRTTPAEFGVEMDLHAYGDRLVVHHDSFTDALDFERWLDAYAHGTIILNVKEEGIESRVRDIVLARGITDFFMLDLSFPALMKMAAKGERRLAVRVSEYEPVFGALLLAGRADWVWLDVFHGFPINVADVRALKTAGFRLCLVSPELHGRPIDEIGAIRRQIDEMQVAMDAVCTKRPDLW